VKHFIPAGDMGHDVTHDMDLAPLPGATGKRLTDVASPL
jgi:hypothetical protein